MVETEMVGYDPVFDILELVLCSKYIAGEKPVSLLLLSEAESGRTEAIKKFRSNHGVRTYRRFTAFGYTRDLVEKKVHLLFDYKTKTGRRVRILPVVFPLAGMNV